MADKPASADPAQPHSIVMKMQPGPVIHGNRSYYRHAAPEAACAEAARLAKLTPGTRYSVYHAGESFKVEKA